MNKSEPSPRKYPQQHRSRNLVERIFMATYSLLFDGPNADSISTNKVAEKAGISIGSLYQYFPNKDSIISDLVEKQLNEDYAEILKIIVSMRGETLKKKAEVIIKYVVDLHWKNRRFFRAVMKHIPRFQKVETILHNREKGRQIIQELLEEELHSKDTSVSSFVIVHAIMGVIESCIMDQSFSITKEQVQRELVALVCNYLQEKTAVVP